LLGIVGAVSDIKSSNRVYFYCYVPEHLQRALWDYAEEAHFDPRRLRGETIAKYVEHLMRGGLMSEEIPHPLGFSETIPNPLGVRKDAGLIPLLLDLPRDVAWKLGNLCEETGVTKGAVIALAIDQFIRANGIERREEHE
jgi:hypothetical protein